MRSASSVSSAARVQGTAFVVLFVIGFAHLLNDMIQSVVPAVYPLIKEKFGLSFAQIGIITLVFQLTSSILQPFVGRYADRHPRPYSLFVGMCFTLVGLCALAVAPDFRVLVAAVSIIGFGSSIFHPEASQVAQLASGGRKGLAQSIFQVGGNGGTAVGPLLAALVVVPYGQGAIGWFSLAAIVAAVVLVRVGKWYSRQLAHARAVSGAMDSEGCGLSRKTIRRAMAMLIVLMFSKHFYIACINSYFTFFLSASSAFRSRHPSSVSSLFSPLPPWVPSQAVFSATVSAASTLFGVPFSGLRLSPSRSPIRVCRPPLFCPSSSGSSFRPLFRPFWSMPPTLCLARSG